MNRSEFLKASFAALMLGVTLAGAAVAGEAGSKEEAEAMAKRAVALIKANGPAKAYAEFINGTTFKDRDLYVSVFDMNGVNLAHGANPKMVGKNLWELKDSDGVEIIKMQTAIAKEKGSGWSVPFHFVNPTTKRLQEKQTYVERVNDTWVGVGYYR